MKPPYAIGSVPSLSGHAIAYRWRSLPRVRRHRASKPQGSSERVLPWQITMDQLIFASLSHTHYWYEVGMLKVPAEYIHSTVGACFRVASAARFQVESRAEPAFHSTCFGKTAAFINFIFYHRLMGLKMESRCIKVGGPRRPIFSDVVYLHFMALEDHRFCTI